MGELLASAGKQVEAVAQYRSAVDIFEKMPRPKNIDADIPNVLARTQIMLGSQLVGLNRLEEAAESFRKAVALGERLVSDFPNDSAHQAVTALGQLNLGFALAQIRKHSDAEGHYRKSIELYEKLVAGVSAEPDYRSGLGNSHAYSGATLASLGKREPAKEQHQKALAIREGLATEFSGVTLYRLDLSRTYSDLGAIESGGDRPADSLPWFEKAIAIQSATFRADSDSAAARQLLRYSYQSRADALGRLGRHEESLRDWDKVIELSPPEALLDAKAQRACLRARLGKLAEAIAEATEITKSDSTNGERCYNLACVYSVASGKDAAKKSEYADRAMELLQNAAKLGFKDAALVAKDPDLDSLRTRDDFKKLLADLEKK